MENGKKLIFLFFFVNLIVFFFSVKVLELFFEYKFIILNKYLLFILFLLIVNYKLKLL